MEKRLSVHEYKSYAEKRVDFVQGFVGWFLISGLFLFSCFAITLAFFSVGQEGTGNTNTVFSIPLFINGFILFWLFSKRKWRGWGMLSAIGLNAFITFLVSYFLTGSFSLGWFTNSPGFEISFVGLFGLLNIPYWLFFLFA